MLCIACIVCSSRFWHGLKRCADRVKVWTVCTMAVTRADFLAMESPCGACVPIFRCVDRVESSLTSLQLDYRRTAEGESDLFACQDFRLREVAARAAALSAHEHLQGEQAFVLSCGTQPSTSASAAIVLCESDGAALWSKPASSGCGGCAFGRRSATCGIRARARVLGRQWYRPEQRGVLRERVAGALSVCAAGDARHASGRRARGRARTVPGRRVANGRGGEDNGSMR